LGVEVFDELAILAYKTRKTDTKNTQKLSLREK